MTCVFLNFTQRTVSLSHWKQPGREELMLARRRIQSLKSHLLPQSRSYTIDLGRGISIKKRSPKSPHLVPKGYLFADLSEETMTHLRWLAQKDLLGQDAFLLGPPGPNRRWLALAYGELTGREVEYLSLTRDTTESDLKSRREIMNGQSIFIHQAPVRAALHGKLLILEGIEKAERNVLPTLNNLLENREMGLEDGHFILNPHVYDKLLASGSHSEQDLLARRLLRCSPDFRVIALGLPIPPFVGRTLDPPLRSRFQCRMIGMPDPLSSLSSSAAAAGRGGGRVEAEGGGKGEGMIGGSLPWLLSRRPLLPATTRSIASPSTINRSIALFAETLHQLNNSSSPSSSSAVSPSSSSSIPLFPSWILSHTSALLQTFPGCGQGQALARIYPSLYTIGGGEGKTTPQAQQQQQQKQRRNSVIQGLAEKLGVLHDVDVVGPVLVKGESSGPGQVMLRFEDGSNIAVQGGELVPQNTGLKEYVETQSTQEVLTAMMQEHALGRDVCLLGGKGVGKSRLAHLFAHRLGYLPEIFPLYKDMTPRDLFQRRSTDQAGNTLWEDGPLVIGAKQGRVVVLDGIHHLHPHTLSTLQRLVLDREGELYDGTRLVRAGSIEGQEGGGGQGGMIPVHPSFRIIALGQVLTARGGRMMPGWLQQHHQETSTLFSWLHLKPLTPPEHHHVLTQTFPTLSPTLVNKLMAVEEGLGSEEEGDDLTLSTRQLMRLARRIANLPLQVAMLRLPELVHEALMTRFAPTQVREVVNDVLTRAGLQGARGGGDPFFSSARRVVCAAEKIDISPTHLTIHHHQDQATPTSIPRRSPLHPELVPHPLFYTNPQHTHLLSQLLADYLAGENAILLVGNQGVGKNKLCDRFLELLNAEREYIQLHRDTTLHSLTVVPNLIDGRIVYEDSPLVRAVQHGRILVVDEADKAPLEVVTLLKGLLEDNYLLLGDGRKVVEQAAAADSSSINRHEGASNGDASLVVPIHPDFRMIVLANRPGFPFAGNDFFGAAGDIFCCHAIDNPDIESEILLLASYAPSLPTSLRRRLALAFADLRDLHTDGVLSYPYSIREGVALIKHLDAYPQDGVLVALENVLGFDSYAGSVRETIAQVFRRRGIPLQHASSQSASSSHLQQKVELADPHPLPPAIYLGQCSLVEERDGRAVRVRMTEEIDVKQRAWPLQSISPGNYSIQASRIDTFTEEVGWIDLTTAIGSYGGHPLSLTRTSASDLHVLGPGPLRLFSYYDTHQGGGSFRRIELIGGGWGGMGSYLDDDPYLVPLQLGEGKGGDKVGVVFPRKGYMIMINARGGGGQEAATLIELPTPLSSSSSSSSAGVGREGGWVPPSWMMLGSSREGGSGGSRKKRGKGLAAGEHGLIQVVVDRRGLLLYYAKGGSSLSLLNVQEGRVTHLHPSRVKGDGEVGVEIEYVGLAVDKQVVVWGKDGGMYALEGSLLEGKGGAGVNIRRVKIEGDGENKRSAASTRAFEGQVSSSVSSYSDSSNSKTYPSSSSSSFYLSAPGSHYQAIQPWPPFPLSSSTTNSNTSKLLTVPRLQQQGEEGEQQQQLQEVQFAKAMSRIGHLASILSSSSSSSSSALEVIDPSSRVYKTIQLKGGQKEQGGEQQQAVEVVGLEQIKGEGEEGGGSRLALLVTSSRSSSEGRESCIRILEVEEEALWKQVRDWKLMFPGGVQGREEMMQRMKAEEEGRRKRREKGGKSIPKFEANRPKHGKEDEKNEPHVGGSTWAGGSGGTDTAGLGGRGGPYRLDKGHVVHQVSDELKAQVTTEAKAEAARLGREALARRLEEIGMGEGEWGMYEGILNRVKPQVEQLRQVLEGLRETERERVWVRHQIQGELDDAKLVDGMAGDRAVFKRRAEVEQEEDMLSSERKGKERRKRRMMFVLDCSGSMYRFNGEDGRLDRLLETATMIMEAFATPPEGEEGLSIVEDSFEYTIVGHSGDSPRLPFVPFGKPPKTKKERLATLQRMAAHSQFCLAGDFTLEATEQAAAELASSAAEGEDGESKTSFLFVVSDCNLDRYRIDPRELGAALTKYPQVRGHIFMIASLGDEAEQAVRSMPVGRAHLCLDTSTLPTLLKNIFQDELATASSSSRSNL